MTKAQWRTRILQRVSAMTPAQRAAASTTLAARLTRLPAYNTARWIGVYLATAEEVETRGMIRQALADGKRVAAPIPNPATHTIRWAELTGVRHGLVRGPFGIEQPHPTASRPANADRLDLLLVPGVAFDKSGYRLGRGVGYYDRLLATLPPAIPRIGLAFRRQRVARLPRERHDQPVTTVLVA